MGMHKGWIQRHNIEMEIYILLQVPACSENEENIYSSELNQCFAIDVVIFWVIGKLSWMLLKAAKHSKINAAL